MSELANAGVSRAFISHAHADIDQARRLKAALSVDGISGWLAPDDIVGHESWAGELAAEIGRCDSFVVLVSTTTLASKHVEREVTLAVEHDKPVLPVLLERVSLTGPLAYLLSSRHWVEAVGGITQRAAEDILRRLSVDRTVPAPPESTRGRGRVSWDESRVPVPLDPIIGRDAIVESVVDAVRAGRRLITLRGPGGVGKTRLALEVAHRVAEEELASVVFADLSEAMSASDLCVGMANALGYVGPDPWNPVEIAQQLSNQRTLLVCDNLEQVASESTPLHQLLEAAPALVALVTSRRKLDLPGEELMVVPPLELGAEERSGQEPMTSPAVEMFLQVARHADPGFAPLAQELTYVDRVCRALDGLPLALELAASRLAMMSPSQLWERIGRPLSRTTSRPGAARRQASVEATIEWSLSQLSPQALAGFTRLGVFSGGFTLEAVERVCATEDESGADVDQWLAELVDVSLVQSADAPSGRRFFMLQLLLAAARRRPVDPELERRHATFFSELAEGLRTQPAGPGGTAMIRGLVDDLENWSRALSWAARHDPHLYHRLARRWRSVWVSKVRPADVLASRLSTEDRASLTVDESAALVALSAVAAYLTGAEGARDDLERAVEGTPALMSDAELLVLAWSFLAAARLQSGDTGLAREAARQARTYAEELGSLNDQSVAHDVSGYVASASGDLAEARQFAARSLQLSETLEDELGICFALSTLGQAHVAEGDAEAVRACARRLLNLVEQGRGLEINEIQGQHLLLLADVMSESWAAAASRLLRSLTNSDSIPANLVGDVLAAAAVLSATGHFEDARHAYSRAQQLGRRFELDDSVTDVPLRAHLAPLKADTSPPTTGDQGGSSLVPSDLLDALRRVVAEQVGHGESESGAITPLTGPSGHPHQTS